MSHYVEKLPFSDPAITVPTAAVTHGKGQKALPQGTQGHKSSSRTQQLFVPVGIHKQGQAEMI